MKLLSFVPMEKKRYQGICLVMIQLAWRMSSLFSPWMRCTEDETTAAEWASIQQKMDQVDKEVAKGEGKPRPLMILGNHTSFFDTLLSAQSFPTAVLWRCRTYMDSGLFKMPILSTVCRSIGHFAVHFKSTEEGVFKVDKDKNDAEDKLVNEHLDTGGWLCFFPEGTVNKDPEKLLPFRFGGMKKALETDSRLIMFVSVGNNKVWPKKAKIGGLPGRVRYGMRVLAPDGAKAFVAELRKQKDLSEEDKAMLDHELLAKHAQIRMQAQYDKLKAELNSNGKNKSD
eukprot:TRINITY_DN90684_c0_g1_i1.p1 TRINITY_DN90684_c0_g1~~TRINITY_DN90684_c0_g1_i1.p1  ORF type:complete len:320 (-),score=70.74 TRINITY_DN90684_c0_g1_i1:22-873(-)